MCEHPIALPVSKYSTVGNGGFLELGGALASTFNGTINNLITDSKGALYAMGNFTNQYDFVMLIVTAVTAPFLRA